jgi:hydroxypyruvate reductase
MKAMSASKSNLGRLRKDAEAVFRAGLKAVDPIEAVKRHLTLSQNRLTVGSRDYDLRRFERILVVGAGKASAAMAQAVEDVLGDRIQDGWVNVKYGHTLPLRRVRLHEAGHPVPDAAGWQGARSMEAMLKGTGARDLVLCLLSGGGSALLPYPVAGVKLEEKQKLTRLLLESGAAIQEINALRKHVSRIKGGRLARMAYPSPLISVILSDVIGDDLDSIASGPAVPDRSTFADCLEILARFSLSGRVPPSVLRHLEKGARGEVEETPKREDPIFQNTFHIIVASNILALQAARRKAEALGYNTLLLSSFVEGETREVARVHTAVVKEILKTGNPIPRPACFLSGGETTVTIVGRGLGGRNQEFSLAAALEIDSLENVVILSAGTDGTDGPTDAAGAWADGLTVTRARTLGMDPRRFLRENDSYRFFAALEDLFVTGPTLTNVMDLRVVVVG